MPWIGRRARVFGHRHHGVDPVLEQLPDQRLLVGEAPVNGADPDPGLTGDVVQGRVEAALGEHLGGGGEDALPVPLGVPAQRPFGSALTGPWDAGRGLGRSGHDAYPTLTGGDFSVSCYANPVSGVAISR